MCVLASSCRPGSHLRYVGHSQVVMMVLKTPPRRSQMPCHAVVASHDLVFFVGVCCWMAHLEAGF